VIPHEMVTMMERRRLVAEVRTASAVQALGVVDALASAGITIIEISLAIPGAPEIVSHLAMRQDVLVGAGAVLEPRQARDLISCGARFIASPIYAPDLVAVCRDANVVCILGALTPTEVIAAQRAGAEMVKLFPGEALGGPAYIRAMIRQLTHVSLQISGGFTAENLGEYLALPVRTLALGDLLVPPMLVERGSWQAITNRARAFVEYASNPHVFAARFLAMMGIAPRPQPTVAAPPPPPPVAPVPVAAPPVTPVPAPDPAAVPTAQSTPPAPQPVPVPAAPAEQPFKPWDSRPLDNGDEEDWLR
jgi:2-dehydro-3-deoxyphosphogluconate aldolase/(4S)-4-hydroxy-2-oxoglutarate aldolase